MFITGAQLYMHYNLDQLFQIFNGITWDINDTMSFIKSPLPLDGLKKSIFIWVIIKRYFLFTIIVSKSMLIIFVNIRGLKRILFKRKNNGYTTVLSSSQWGCFFFLVYFINFYSLKLIFIHSGEKWWVFVNQHIGSLVTINGPQHLTSRTFRVFGGLYIR